MGLLLAGVTSAAAGDGREGERIRDSIRTSSSYASDYEGVRSGYSAHARQWRAFEDDRFEDRRKAGVTDRAKGQY
jgi:hypothetical protein